EDKDAILVPKPHKHWGLDPDDFDLLYSRTDLPFQRFTAAPGVVACAAMAGVSATAESRAMWTAATDLYLREFRTSGEAFRRRAT
ncbi:hypothetical protein, partial [Limosilactobacillus reuteri]|uniref:hypothetical protein n=1 Tax=Limosilactobacillus reuteri TaxID=1598 RepID=UPI00207D6AB5